MEPELSTVRATVRAIEQSEVIVEVEQGGCGRCHEEGGCGGQQLTQMFCAGPKTYRLENTGSFKLGDQVLVAIAPGAVRKTANLVYGLPLLAAIVCAVIGTQIAGDSGGMLGGLLGVVLAFIAVTKISQLNTGKNVVRPYIVSRS